MKGKEKGGSLEMGLSSQTPCDPYEEALGPEKDQKPMPTMRENVKKEGKSFTIR